MSTWHSSVVPSSRRTVQTWRSSSHVRRLDGDAEAQVRAQPELVDGLLEVLLQLGLLGVRAGPVVRLERVGVEVRADVDLGARVRVVPPGAADAERRLVDRERVDAGALHLHAGGDPAEAGAHDDDPRRPRRTEQLLGGWASRDASRVDHELEQVAVGVAHVHARRRRRRARRAAPPGLRRPRHRRCRAPPCSDSGDPSHTKQTSPHGGARGRCAEGEVVALPHLGAGGS